MFAFLNVNRDQRARHVHVDTGIIDCGNGGVRRFELTIKTGTTGTREKRVFRRLAIFTDGGKLKKIRVGGKNRRSVGFPETRHFFLGLKLKCCTSCA